MIQPTVGIGVLFLTILITLTILATSDKLSERVTDALTGIILWMGYSSIGLAILLMGYISISLIMGAL